MIKLSIVIPYWNAEPYTSELLDCLRPQISDQVEVILIDDGSKVPFKTGYEWVKVIRKKNGGCSSARNVGLEKAKGEYIAFIDADDILAKNYVQKVFEAMKSKPDVIEHSWKSLNSEGWNVDRKLRGPGDRLDNPSASTRLFKRSFIGDLRFNENKDATEDEDFTRRLGILSKNSDIKYEIIPDYLYFYRDNISDSKTRRYIAGMMNTKQVVYFYNHVSKDMTWLLEEIRKENEVNKVYLMTFQNDIPELEKYCEVIKPKRMWGHIVRGEPYNGLTERPSALRTQVVIYRRAIPEIGGLGTFIDNFVEVMGDKYDITIVSDTIHERKMQEFISKVRVIIKPDYQIACDTLIILSFLDKIPKYIHANKIVRMCHACKTDPTWSIPKDYDYLVYASQTAKDSFKATEGEVVHNFNIPTQEQALLLVSATRLPAPDKGDIENRMRGLAEKLNAAGIPYLWLNFSDGGLKNPPKNFYNMRATSNMQAIMKSATYVVALSDSECWSYSVLEALMLNIPLICTPFPSTKEMGVIDGVNAHIVPFNLDFDANVLKNVPKFEYKYENDKIAAQWAKILGYTKPFKKYEPKQKRKVKILKEYFDVKLQRTVKQGEVWEMEVDRAYHLAADERKLVMMLEG